MKRLIYILIAIGGIHPILLSQTSNSGIDPDAFYYQNALRFSETELNGTARTQSMGGASNALGVDLSSISSNPAGLGLYRKSEISASGALNFRNSESSIGNTTNRRTDDSFGLNNLGAVLSFPSTNPKKKNFNIGLTYNRTNNYNSSFSYFSDGTTSIRDLWAANANGTDISVFDDAINPQTGEVSTGSELGLAYATFLIDPTGDNTYENRNRGELISIDETVSIRGRKGIVNLRQELTFNYTETATVGATDNFESFNYRETETTTGSGANLKLGIINKVSDNFRIGIGLETPTVLSLTETYTRDLESSFNNKPFQDGDDTFFTNGTTNFSPNFETVYTVRTPLKLNSGLAYFFGKKGFITADVNYQTFSRISVESQDFNTDPENSTIVNNFNSTLNVKIGGEYRKDNIRLRAGYATFGNPLNNSLDSERTSTQYFTGGIGFKWKNQFLDFALVHSIANSSYSKFETPDDVLNVSNNFSNTSIQVTGGLKF